MALSRINTNQIVDGAVATADIADGLITTAKLADNAVTTAKTTDANITTAKLADNAVTQAKIGADAVGTNELANDVAINTSAKATINLASSGNAVDLKLSDTTIGNIGVISDRVYLTAEGSHGVYLDASANNFCPSSTTGTDNDGNIDLGASFARWKDAYFSGGIHIGGTGSANELEDYEEGTWTASQSVGGNSSISASEAQYVKVGRMVYVSVAIAFSGNDVDRVSIAGLPFTCNSSGHGFGNFSYVGASSQSAVNLMPIVATSGDYIYFHRQDGTANNWTNAQQRSTSYNQPHICSAIYETDS